MDVKTTFLNSELNEEIYMALFEGFVVHEQENKVCRLVKSLYGLKQAPKKQHEKFEKVIKSNGFLTNDYDKYVYLKVFNDACVILYLYVDNIFIFGTNLEVIIETKIFLCSNFDMKDLGVADVILGIKLIKLDNEFILTQSHYVENLLKIFNYYEVKFVLTPYDPNQH